MHTLRTAKKRRQRKPYPEEHFILWMVSYPLEFEFEKAIRRLNNWSWCLDLHFM